MEVGTAPPSLSIARSWPTRLPAQSRHLIRRTSASGTWKPRITPFGGSRLQSLPMAMREQDWGESERCPVIGWIGVETSLYAKAGRLPLGLSSHESFYNHLNGRRANE